MKNKSSITRRSLLKSAQPALIAASIVGTSAGAAVADEDRGPTWDEIAAMDFEAWNMADCPFPNNAEWARLANPYLVTARIAWAANSQTKAALIETAAAMECDDMLISTLDRYTDAISWFQSFAVTLETARARLVAAGLNV